jgi:hypothetical protein
VNAERGGGIGVELFCLMLECSEMKLRLECWERGQKVDVVSRFCKEDET